MERHGLAPEAFPWKHRTLVPGAFPLKHVEAEVGAHGGGQVPGEVLLFLPLLPCLPGQGHIGPIGKGLQETANVLVFGP